MDSGFWIKKKHDSVSPDQFTTFVVLSSTHLHARCAGASHMNTGTYSSNFFGSLTLKRLSEGTVFEANNHCVSGSLTECLIFPTEGGSFTDELLSQGRFKDLAHLVSHWQQPQHSQTLREAIAQLLYKKTAAGFEFHFREVWVMGNGAISVVVGDAHGMAYARRTGLVPHAQYVPTLEVMQANGM
jgi:hypothetical protein